jgi:tetratricopeptide (TPR) repeat protein
LVIVTHWEREWRELKQSSAQAPRVAIGAPTDLCWLDGEPGVEVRILEPAPSNALAEYLGARLTGLTPAQRELMLDKAAGNFLTLVENVGQLLRVPQNFVDHVVAKPLSTAGERKVREWESDRQKRVEQRFTELAPELQDMLGWGSHLGVSFLREVVEEYAERVSGMRGAPDRLREAVDPLVILGEPSEHLREFRDRAFHHVARRHFEDYGQEHADALDTVLRERLIEWVNNSFDEDGYELWPDPEEVISAPSRSVTGLTNEEARDVLSMAVRCLPIPEQPDWDNPADTAALRARILLVVVDMRENLWDRVKLNLDKLDRPQAIDPNERVIANTLVAQLARTAWTAGARVLALSLANARLARARSTAAAFGIAESQRKLRESLELVASLEHNAGNFEGALASYEKALQISSKLAEDMVTPEHQRDLSWSLDFVAHVKAARGNSDDARRSYERSFEIRLALKSSLGTAQAERDLSVSLNNLARVLAATGQSEEALEKSLASLEIRRALADSLRTPESRGDVAWNLRLIAGIERARGNWESALQHYREALAIRRSVASSSCTPQKDRDLSISLQDVAEVEYWHGDREASIVMYRESLELCCSVHHALNTSETLHELNTLGIRLIDVIESVATRDWIHSTFASALARLELVLDLTVELERLGNARLLTRLVKYSSFRADMLQARRRTVDAKLARVHAALICDRIASLAKKGR